MYRIGKHRTFTSNEGMILKFCPKESWRSCARFRSPGPADRKLQELADPKQRGIVFFRVGFYKAKKNTCRGGTRTTHFETCKWRGRMSHISALGVVWVWTQMTFFSTWTIWATFASKQECLKSQETRGSPFQHMHIEWRNITRSKTHQRHSILYPRPIKPPFPALVRTMWGLVLPRHLFFFRFFLQNLQCFATMKRNFFTWQVSIQRVVFESFFAPAIIISLDPMAWILAGRDQRDESSLWSHWLWRPGLQPVEVREGWIQTSVEYGDVGKFEILL